MNPEAAPNAACLKVWDELTPSERAFAQTLGLDEASWPKWYERSSALERGDEDDENERNWPEEVVRHSARTAASWMDLTISEREAAQQLGYDQGLWAAFCCSEDDPVHRWSLNECEGEAECWGELHNPRYVYRCAHNCAKIRCPNFEICGEEGDGFFVNLKGRCLDAICTSEKTLTSSEATRQSQPRSAPSVSTTRRSSNSRSACTASVAGASAGSKGSRAPVGRRRT